MQQSVMMRCLDRGERKKYHESKRSTSQGFLTQQRECKKWGYLARPMNVFKAFSPLPLLHTQTDYVPLLAQQETMNESVPCSTLEKIRDILCSSILTKGKQNSKRTLLDPLIDKRCSACFYSRKAEIEAYLAQPMKKYEMFSSPTLNRYEMFCMLLFLQKKSRN